MIKSLIVGFSLRRFRNLLTSLNYFKNPTGVKKPDFEERLSRKFKSVNFSNNDRTPLQRYDYFLFSSGRILLVFKHPKFTHQQYFQVNLRLLYYNPTILFNHEIYLPDTAMLVFYDGGTISRQQVQHRL